MEVRTPMAHFTLDDIREAADRKYGEVVIDINEDESVALVNAIRLPKEKRDALQALQSELSADSEDGEDVDQAETFRKALRLVATDKRKVDKLIKALGDDLALLATVFETYAKGTELGEASASAN